MDNLTQDTLSWASYVFTKTFSGDTQIKYKAKKWKKVTKMADSDKE